MSVRLCKMSFLKIVNGLQYLLLGVHYELSIPHDGFMLWPACNKGQSCYLISKNFHTVGTWVVVQNSHTVCAYQLIINPNRPAIHKDELVMRCRDHCGELT